MALSRSKWLQNALEKLEAIAPLRLAEKSWDNVGLLVEAPRWLRPNAQRVLLALDATPAVVREAVDDESVVLVVAYHPTIFRGWKRLNLQTSADPETINQDSVLRLAAAGVSLYSPHTALDNVVGGINDWLLDALDGLGLCPERHAIIPHESEPGAGGGRIGVLEKPTNAKDIVDAVRRHLGLSYIRVAWANGPEAPTNVVRVAVCAGSGGSVLELAAAQGDVDMVITGELGHHEILRLRARCHVVLCEHWGSEHGYISARLLAALQKAGLDVNASVADQAVLQLIT